MRGTGPKGEEIRAARMRRAWTQAQLAQIAGLDVKTVRKAEQGKRIDFVPLSRLAAALEIDVGRIMAPSEGGADLEHLRRQAVLNWFNAFEARDIETLVNLFHDDAVIRIPGGPEIVVAGVHQGKERIRWVHELAWQVPQEPARLEEMSIHPAGNTVIMIGEKGWYGTDGTHFMVRVIHVFTFQDELILEYEIQYDTQEFSRRMGPGAKERIKERGAKPTAEGAPEKSAPENGARAAPD